MDKLVYLLYPILLIIFGVGAKWMKKGEWNEEFLSLKQTKRLQGFTAILIMLHHIGQKTCASWLDPKIIRPGLEIFVPYGFYFVGIFLLCSGYGLYKSFTTKENYLEGFFRKRILPLIVAFYSAGFVFLIVRLLLGQKMSIGQFLLYVIGFSMPNPNSWYVIAVPLFYFIFYLSFRFCKEEKKAVTCTCLGILAYIIFGTFIRHNSYWMCGEWWYNSAHFFPLGILFARHEKEIIAKVKKNYKVFLFGGFILIFVMKLVADLGRGWFGYYYGEYGWNAPLFSMVWRKWPTVFGEQLASCAFVFWVFILMMKLKIGNKLMDFFGKITLEFYIIHGLFVELFCGSFCGTGIDFWKIKNVFVFVVVTFVLGTMAALLLQRWMNFVMRKNK